MGHSVEERLEAISATLRSKHILGSDKNPQTSPEQLQREGRTHFKVWRERSAFFEGVMDRLGAIARDARHERKEVWNRTLRVQESATHAEHLLNLVLDDGSTPAQEIDASIRYVVEKTELRRSSVVDKALCRTALKAPDPNVRRLAWVNLCNRRAQRKQFFFFGTPVFEDSNPEDSNQVAARQSDKMVQELRTIRSDARKKRGALGPRGTLVATAPGDHRSAILTCDLLGTLGSDETPLRNEIALTLGEIGGEEAATYLADALKAEIRASAIDDGYQVHLVSALANLGGKASIDALLYAVEGGSERVRLVALSALEGLATAGATALTEYSEPAPMEEKLAEAHAAIRDRLRAVAEAADTGAYVRHKVSELLDLIVPGERRNL